MPLVRFVTPKRTNLLDTYHHNNYIELILPRFMKEDVRESYKKMIGYEIPKEDRKKLINTCYSCIGRFHSFPYLLNQAYEQIDEKKLKGEKALSKIEKYLTETTTYLIKNESLQNGQMF